jgi:hypothetical protein
VLVGVYCDGTPPTLRSTGLAVRPRLFALGRPAQDQYRPGDELGWRPELPYVELDDLVHPQGRRKDCPLRGTIVDEQLTTERTARPDELEYRVIDVG